MERNPRTSGDKTVFTAIAIALFLVAFAIVFWPRGPTTGPVMRADSPPVERTPTSPAPAPAPTKPAQ
jgi:hypothetical protein